MKEKRKKDSKVLVFSGSDDSIVSGGRWGGRMDGQMGHGMNGGVTFENQLLTDRRTAETGGS